MSKETPNKIVFSSSFLSKLFFLVLGLCCFGLLASGELLTAITSGVQAEFFIPPFLFKLLLLVCGITFLLLIFSCIKIDRHGLSTSFLLAFIEPIAWEKIGKIKIEQVLVKRQPVLQIHIHLKKGCYAQRRLLWFFRQRISQWSFSWPLQLKSHGKTIAQAIEQFAPKGIVVQGDVPQNP